MKKINQLFRTVAFVTISPHQTYPDQWVSDITTKHLQTLISSLSKALSSPLTNCIYILNCSHASPELIDKLINQKLTPLLENNNRLVIFANGNLEYIIRRSRRMGPGETLIICEAPRSEDFYDYLRKALNHELTMGVKRQSTLL